MVINRNITLYSAAKSLRISGTTAKSIISYYKKLGVILKRNTPYQIKKMGLKPAKQEEDEIKY